MVIFFQSELLQIHLEMALLLAMILIYAEIENISSAQKYFFTG
jgi:hypothetical protein